MSNLDLFLSTYRKHLKQTRSEYPTEYAWPESMFEDVYSRMAEALEKGTYNKDGRALKATCKELGVKHTYKAINEYLRKG